MPSTLRTEVEDGVGSIVLTRADEYNTITPALRDVVRKLNQLARARGQTLPQMAIAWILRRPEITSVLIGASDVNQIAENVRALDKLQFSPEELQQIDVITLPR